MIFCLIIALVFYYFKVVCPVIVTLSEEKVRSLATSTISEVVGETLVQEDVKYTDIAKVKYSSSNTIDMIAIDTTKANVLIRKITYGVQEKFDELGNNGIDIALGTFSGIPFLYETGPQISVQLVPIGTVNTKINSKFTSAGINQTLHQLYFVVSAGIGMILPAKTQKFNTELEVMLCESVIVGKVPDVYLQGNII